jgi:hypothetical protein
MYLKGARHLAGPTLTFKIFFQQPSAPTYYPRSLSAVHAYNNAPAFAKVYPVYLPWQDHH